MFNNEMEPRVLEDGMAYVRKHPQMFFGERKPNARDCLQLLVGEVLASGAQDLGIRLIDEWWIISSPFDWLSGIELNQVFNRIIAFPAMAQNAMRVEVVIAAFANEAATFGARTGRVTVKGQVPPDMIWAEMERSERSIAFRFEPD